MDGSATSVGLNFQERLEKEHPKKKGGDGDDYKEFYRAQCTTCKIQRSLCLSLLN